ncbi:MAG TPA: translation factor GTPase family protein [Streptosporangiaceae bacterium]|nr:translation factor GTPase family protein [Streptosporangiaceae bacterium]
MSTLNLGILAHVDAGKTSLTERLLFAAGVIDEIGSVDDGSTQTDTLALERQRGITIKSAVASFAVGERTVNLIDTPGHPDFIAEVERVLTVLDGAVLVISAVEGVQAQTRVLMRTLQRLRIPTLIFVNKIDRAGAGDERVLRDIQARLTPSIAPMGSVTGPGTRGAAVTPYGPADGAFTTGLADLLADHDDAFLAAYVADEAAAGYGRLTAGLAAGTARGLMHPVFFGSAITGAGVDALTRGLAELLPAAGANAAGTDPGGRADPGGQARGRVFKVERGAAGEKIAYVRMFSGTLRVRDRLRLDQGREGKITAISVFDRGPAAPGATLGTGQIGKLRGLRDVRIGDTLGPAGEGHDADDAAPAASQFAPPTLETMVVAGRAGDRGALHAALVELAEQDPLINLREDDARQEILVSLYGEVQKEVIQATLAAEYGIAVTFRESTTICVERPAGSGAAAELIGVPPNPFLAGVGLRIDPAPPGAGVSFRLEIQPGALPLAFRKAVEETVHQTLRAGLYGWQVTDAAVAMTHSGYYPRQSHAHATFDKSMSSTAGDFRHLTPLVLMDALRLAGTRVHEPVHRFRLEIPADTVGPVLPALGGLGAAVDSPAMHGSSCLLEGEIPASRAAELERQLPGLTRGEGLLETAFDHYRPVRGTVPVRSRLDDNPLNREEYLRRLRGAGSSTSRDNRGSMCI